MVQKEKENKKKLPKGCAFGCLGLIVLLLILGIVGMLTSKDPDKTAKPKKVKGIEVNLGIESNSKSLDEAIVVAEIKNTTDKTYSGTIAIQHPSFKYWEIKIDNLAPGKSERKQIKEKYIEHPEDQYTYDVTGKLEEKNYKSKVHYTLYNRDNDRSYDVQMKQVIKENVVEVMKELYSIHGNNLVNVNFYDESVDVENLDPNKHHPLASYYGTKSEKTISIGNESFNFEP